MQKLALAGFLLILTVALVTAACENEDYEQSSQSPQATGVPQSTTAPEGALEVTQADFRFEPDNLAATAGKAISVDLVNDGKAAHTFTITELNVDKTLQPGDRATLTFTPDKEGSYAFFCRFHRNRGMEGVLTVTGGSGAGLPGY